MSATCLGTRGAGRSGGLSRADHDTTARVHACAVFGGVPAYLRRLDYSGSLIDNIERLALDPDGYFHREPEFPPREELREQRYLVFAKEESPGHFIRPPCSGTHEYNADFARGLGPPVVVAPVEEPPAVTCDPCEAPPPPSDALLSASAVFHGWAIEIEHMGEGRVGPRRITFEVVRWWKGGLESVVTLDVPYGDWTCFDSPFGMSRREFRDDGYIVYADRDLESGALVAQRCGRTARFGRDEASALGPGSPPDGATETATVGPTPTASPTGVPGEPVTATATPVVTPVAPPEPEPTRTPPIGASPAAPGLPGPPAYFPLALDSHFVGSDSLEPVGQRSWRRIPPSQSRTAEMSDG